MEKIERFLEVGYGDGSGSGSGSGYGSGYGYGYGSGSGSGYGDGYGSGDGYGYGYGDGYGDGSGDGYGLKSFNNMRVYNIDGLPTILTHVHGNVAKGFLFGEYFSLIPCYVVKGGGKFAHGETLLKANNALEEKLLEDIDLEEAIDQFKAKWPTLDTTVKASDLYIWHHALTGSCDMGRKQFALQRGIDVEQDSMTVAEFIDLTKNAYGGEAIRQLAEAYQ